jgi:hypothetical protein
MRVSRNDTLCESAQASRSPGCFQDVHFRLMRAWTSSLALPNTTFRRA